MNIDLYIPWLTLVITGLLVGYVIARQTWSPGEIFGEALVGLTVTIFFLGAVAAFFWIGVFLSWWTSNAQL